MPLSLNELIQALPAPQAEDFTPAPRPLREAALQPVPIGRWRRLSLLGSLQAKIAAAYLFHWCRSWFTSADAQERLLAETHWRTAVRILETMGYMRGAVMKIGQTLANFPDIAPKEFVETLNQLHFDAPPMHWSLLREMVANELGDEPERLFAEFDRNAFAAASLGQVHRARLKTGEEVAVKIQYPGIGRTIAEDLRNLILFMFPARISRDWEFTRLMIDDLRMRLEQETDYGREATALAQARSLFRDEDGIVVPRVHRELSTARVLTLEKLDGVHLQEFLAGDPEQSVRNEFGRKIVRGFYRLMFAGRLVYCDFHPGNLLFMNDGRLGWIDFGFLVPLEGELWNALQSIDRALTTGHAADRKQAIIDWSSITIDFIETAFRSLAQRPELYRAVLLSFFQEA
jgi:aarF domain-containing kinase